MQSSTLYGTCSSMTGRVGFEVFLEALQTDFSTCDCSIKYLLWYHGTRRRSTACYTDTRANYGAEAAPKRLEDSAE